MLPILSCSFFLKIQKRCGSPEKTGSNLQLETDLSGHGISKLTAVVTVALTCQTVKDSWPQPMLRGQCWLRRLLHPAKSQKRTRWRRPQKRLKKQEHWENSKDYIAQGWARNNHRNTRQISDFWGSWRSLLRQDCSLAQGRADGGECVEGLAKQSPWSVWTCTKHLVSQW